MPLSGGSLVSRALRRHAEERAFVLSTQAQDHVWDLAEYKRVEPVQCLTGATSGVTGGDQKLVWAYHLLCFVMRMRLVLCMTWVLELDLIKHSRPLKALEASSYFWGASHGVEISYKLGVNGAHTERP